MATYRQSSSIWGRTGKGFDALWRAIGTCTEEKVKFESLYEWIRQEMEEEKGHKVKNGYERLSGEEK